MASVFADDLVLFIATDKYSVHTVKTGKIPVFSDLSKPIEYSRNIHSHQTVSVI